MVTETLRNARREEEEEEDDDEVKEEEVKEEEDEGRRGRGIHGVTRASDHVACVVSFGKAPRLGSAKRNIRG
ncbi:hypothetical protein TRV_02632 [Trichophyton verrucosum HKI 0517]|uniref:Uncharacterized protein n=1 Tax=Trichophyton verrucosum (strain HKI 0517) TaxID=663202 RepID=D4D6A7_TRIVH|nr:uncharacterized protein TRV_02632 [Trichophyton verrucosum HKI 0517]EFE42610.1 hypothetical protein TRV_02632 [Trichophyton verrucosum HKI 0517]